MPENSSGVRAASGIFGTWNEVFLLINRQQQYLWRAVDRFFRRLPNGQGKELFCSITDILRSYWDAMRTILSGVNHNT